TAVAPLSYVFPKLLIRISAIMPLPILFYLNYKQFSVYYKSQYWKITVYTRLQNPLNSVLSPIICIFRLLFEKKMKLLYTSTRHEKMEDFVVLFLIEKEAFFR